MADKHGAHQTDQARVISACEDYCKSPKDPVAYMIWQHLEISQSETRSVRALGTPALNINCRFCHVRGNEGGTGGGVACGVNRGYCRPVRDEATGLNIEGAPAIGHGTHCEMNCASPDSAGNTWGIVQYISQLPNSASKTSASASAKPPVAPKEYWTENGQTIPVYQYGLDSYYSPAEGGFVVIADHPVKMERIASRANERENFRLDSNDGRLDGVPADDQGNRIGRGEAERRSDDASIRALGGLPTWYKLSWGFRYIALMSHYTTRRNLLAMAQCELEQGNVTSARRIADAHPDMQGYWQKLFSDYGRVYP